MCTGVGGGLPRGAVRAPALPPEVACARRPRRPELTRVPCPSPQCQIIYPRQQLLTLRELEMIGFIENNVSKLSLLLSEISRCGALALPPAAGHSLWGRS